MPILQISLPFIISSLVMVDGPISTKYPSPGVEPASIPVRHMLSRKEEIVRLTLCHKVASLGSNTTQLVLALILSST